ncbi:hypothetical protein BD413DRAFT_612603 [Trametes elegans]|nr:hypothetical protein BD413DRAFT_612603 [Trametes elegans]
MPYPSCGSSPPTTATGIAVKIVTMCSLLSVNSTSKNRSDSVVDGGWHRLDLRTETFQTLHHLGIRDPIFTLEFEECDELYHESHLFVDVLEYALPSHLNFQSDGIHWFPTEMFNCMFSELVLQGLQSLEFTSSLCASDDELRLEDAVDAIIADIFAKFPQLSSFTLFLNCLGIHESSALVDWRTVDQHPLLLLETAPGAWDLDVGSSSTPRGAALAQTASAATPTTAFTARSSAPQWCLNNDQ